MNFDWKDVAVIFIIAVATIWISCAITACAKFQQGLEYWCVTKGHTKAECNLGL